MRSLCWGVAMSQYCKAQASTAGEVQAEGWQHRTHVTLPLYLSVERPVSYPPSYLNSTIRKTILSSQFNTSVFFNYMFRSRYQPLSG
jgi:hypothetical protein